MFQLIIWILTAQLSLVLDSECVVFRLTTEHLGKKMKKGPQFIRDPQIEK